MEIWTAIGQLSPGVAVGVLCLYFYNQLTIRILDERKEWVEVLQRLLDRYDLHIQASVDAREKAAAQDHALRGKVQEFIGTVQNQYMAMQNQLVAIDSHLKEIANRLRGSGND